MFRHFSSLPAPSSSKPLLPMPSSRTTHYGTVARHRNLCAFLVRTVLPQVIRTNNRERSGPTGIQHNGKRCERRKTETSHEAHHFHADTTNGRHKPFLSCERWLPVTLRDFKHPKS